MTVVVVTVPPNKLEASGIPGSDQAGLLFHRRQFQLDIENGEFGDAPSQTFKKAGDWFAKNNKRHGENDRPSQGLNEVEILPSARLCSVPGEGGNVQSMGKQIRGMAQGLLLDLG
jgi:hypothetical protein